VGRQGEKREDRCRLHVMDASRVEPTKSLHSAVLSWLSPCPLHFPPSPRVCGRYEVVVVVVFVCSIRSVLSIGGCYTYSNLFFFWFFLVLFYPSPCVRLDFFSELTTTLDTRLDLFTSCFSSLLRWFVCTEFSSFCPSHLPICSHLFH